MRYLDPPKKQASGQRTEIGRLEIGEVKTGPSGYKSSPICSRGGSWSLIGRRGIRAVRGPGDRGCNIRHGLKVANDGRLVSEVFLPKLQKRSADPAVLRCGNRQKCRKRLTPTELKEHDL